MKQILKLLKFLRDDARFEVILTIILGTAIAIGIFWSIIPNSLVLPYISIIAEILLIRMLWKGTKCAWKDAFTEIAKSAGEQSGCQAVAIYRRYYRNPRG